MNPVLLQTGQTKAVRTQKKNRISEDVTADGTQQVLFKRSSLHVFDRNTFFLLKSWREVASLVSDGEIQIQLGGDVTRLKTSSASAEGFWRSARLFVYLVCYIYLRWCLGFWTFPLNGQSMQPAYMSFFGKRVRIPKS